MAKQPAPFQFTLTEAEVGEIGEPAGQGGHQALHARLIAQLNGGNRTVELNDCELGELMRYMTRYGSGGFQGRLHRAFVRSIRELLS